jgi:phosphatidylglycerol:prolipoprotein diacylglycerol transferase
MAPCQNTAPHSTDSPPGAAMFVHPQFDPIALQLGPIAVRWYGLMYLVAFLGFFLLGRLRLSRGPHAALTGMNSRDLEDLLFYGAMGVVLGGRLGYVLFYKPAYYLAHPLEIPAVWQGGMAFHGGLLGVIVAIALWSRLRGKHLLAGHRFRRAAGADRAGRRAAGQLHQRRVVGAAHRCGLGHGVSAGGRCTGPPSFAALPVRRRRAGAVCAAVVVLGQASAPAAVSGMFLIGYGTFRFMAEFARQPDAFLGILAFGLTMGQLLSLPMIVAGLLLWRWALRRGASAG